MLKSVPAYVYAAADSKEGFKINYTHAREFPAFQFNALTGLAETHSTNDCKMSFVYYPSLVKSDANNYMLMRVKLEINGDASGKTFKGVFGDQFVGEDAPLEECFVEVATKTPMETAIYPSEYLEITKIFR